MRPANASPSLYRFWAEGPDEAVAQGELAREPRVALVEAALLAADEPLTARRLAVRTHGNVLQISGHDRQYLSGFGNHFETEAVPGALPVGQNNPRIGPP